MINKKGGRKPTAQLRGGSRLHTDAFCELLPRPRPVKAILPRESEEVRAGLSIWFYIYKDQMASLEMIFDLGRSRNRAKIFFFYFFFPCSLFNLLSVYGRGLSRRSGGELCVRLSGPCAVGLGVRPALPTAAADPCGRVGLVVKALSGVVQGGRQSWIPLHHRPAAWKSASTTSCTESN